MTLPFCLFEGGFAPQRRGSEAPSFFAWREGETMPLKDLRGKTVHDLDWGDFDKLFCSRCLEREECPRDNKKILGCKAFVDTGLWDKFYRKQ